MECVTVRKLQDAKWSLGYLDAAVDEGHKILSDEQYHQVVDVFEQLSMYENPRTVDVFDIKPIESFFELRDKWGVFGKLNVRTFFTLLDGRRIIFVIGCCKKEQEGKTPGHIVGRMRNRLRHVDGLVREWETKSKGR